MNRRWIVAGLVLTAVGGLSAQEHADREIEGGGVLPAGWEFRTDKGMGMDNVRFEQTESGLQLTLGPRVILYRPDDTASGDYSVSATFRQLAQHVHAEAYGLIIGGVGLRGPDQVYTYFLIRGTGHVLVKRRFGTQTANISDGWEAHSTVNAADSDGRSVNELTVTVSGSTVSFDVNGTEVYAGSTDGLAIDGVFGLRASHNLDLIVEGFGKTD